MLDIILRDIDGYEVCRRLRECYLLPNTKIIMLTDKETVEDRLKGYAVGANDCIAKPLEEEHVLASLEFLL